MRWRWPSITSSTPARTSLVAAPASGRCSSKLVSLVGISSNMLRADTRSPALTQRNGTHRSVAGMRAEKRDLGHECRCVRSSFLASGWGRRAWRQRCTRVRTRRWWTTSSPAEHAGGGGPAALASVIAGGGGPARARGDGAPRWQSTPSTVLGHAHRWAEVGAAPASRRGSQRGRGRRVTGAERGRGHGVAGASPPPGEGGAAPPRR